jgi:tripartite-type tricarboxylate transporter receptor subunit TctC
MNRLSIGALGLLFAALFAQPGYAADFPTKPIRLIVAYPAGGGADFIARTVGLKLSAALGQPVVVDNHPGAGGIIGTEMLAKSKPDGYTLGITIVSHAINPFVYAKLPYDSVRDFAHIARFNTEPNVLVVTPSFPAETVKDLVALAKERPGKITYASAGVGTNSHLSAEMFKHMAGVDLLHVAYKGGPQANSDVVAGTVDLTFPSLALTMPLITGGRLRAMAVTTLKRSPALPDVPTAAETVPGYESIAWYGFSAPAGTPPEIIALLSAEIEKITRMPDVVQSLVSRGNELAYQNPEQFDSYIKSEMKRWGDVVKAAGLKPGSM